MIAHAINALSKRVVATLLLWSTCLMAYSLSHYHYR